jgi:hypothetical protein
MRRVISTAFVATAVLAVAMTASAQTGASGQTGSSETRAVPTASGDTGIWLVPAARVLDHRKWNLSLYEVNTDEGHGFTDVTKYPFTFAYGLGHQLEVFANWSLVTQVDRDTHPLFFTSDASSQSTGTGGGIVLDHPLARGTWSGNQLGDLWVGGKVNLVPHRLPVAVAARAQVKLPTGDTDNGVSSGETDFQIDGIVSGRRGLFDLSGFVGVIIRGEPAGYSLTNGVRWGAGAAVPLGRSFLINGELVGEQYMDRRLRHPHCNPGPTARWCRRRRR